jgi:hypothetical protein
MWQKIMTNIFVIKHDNVADNMMDRIVTYIYILHILESLGFQRVIGSLDPTLTFGLVAPP